jgi:high-affinity iron transporter
LKKHFYIFFLIIASNILFANNPKVQQLIHLLDYLGNDYALAVKDGKVNSEQEYKEMQEFALKIQKQLVEIKLDTIVSLNNDISSLSIKVNAKASPSEIKKIC